MALGRIGAPGDDDCVLATATENGVVRAVLQLVPWGADGLSLDLMRRDKGAQPGLNDFLIVETIKAASGLGVKRISLNFAVFRAALERGERIGAGPVLRAWRSVLIFMSKWFQIESLYKFNAKFGPVWQPRFFVFPSTKDAPRIAMAALEAEAFLVWPRLELRRIARKLGLGRAAPGRRRRRGDVRGGPAARAAEREPLPGHGRGERHAGLVLRRRSVVRGGRGHHSTAWNWPRRAPTSWTSAANRPGPGPSASPRKRSCGGSGRW